jgi:hypothetical protein
MPRTEATLLALTCFLGAGLAQADWVEFVEQTDTRLNAPAAVGADDVEEKDYIWGDVDLDGDTDLVIVRKVPFTVDGGRTNVLLMNEGGVLVDRTAQYAHDADDGGSGFGDLTNDRDVVLAFVNDDIWPDIVTATTLHHGEPKNISHPRVYINKGEIAGVWQGFRYEEARIPQLYTIPGNQAVAPRFCSVAAGDVTGDGRPELYFGDYDSSGGGGEAMPPGADLNDRLLLNDGSGFFSDSAQTRMSATMLESAFGTAVAIEDMNGDGYNDIVKDTGLAFPTRVSISYNNAASEGSFNVFDVIYDKTPYFITVGDLNGDGKLDLVVVDDGPDEVLLNQGNQGGEAVFSNSFLPNSSQFGGNAVIEDLNNDGHNDILIADVDVDGFGCNRQMHIYRNLGNLPNVDFAEQGEVIPDPIPATQENENLTGTHDVAVFDIDGDGWKDLVIGRCTGTEVWINVPPTGLVYSYPNGLPASSSPSTAGRSRNSR